MMSLDTASFQFVVFGLAAALVSNFSRSPAWRAAVLFVSSLTFIGISAGDVSALIPLAGFLLLGYVGLLLLERGVHRVLVWSLVLVVLAYAWLKKYTFIPDGILLSRPYFTLGLSYIFFRVLHLLIEAGDQGGKRYVGLGAYLLYNLNFTTLVSGPIQRYEEFAADQFAAEPIELDPQTIGLQFERIVRGFFKVNVLAMIFDTIHVDALAELAQPVPNAVKLLAAIKLAVSYPLFLYCNFSGYIDIVIALARLMRVRLPENFDRPFSASCVLDFWNQWHMTLSKWLKTYVYNPLLVALMRRIPSIEAQPYLGVFCFFVTFFLVGIWHGRTSEFVMFGFLTGAGMSVNKLWQIGLTNAMSRKGYQALARSPAYASLGRGLNFAWFSFTLFWFWASWAQLSAAYQALGGLDWLAVWISVWLIASAVLAAWEWLRSRLLSIRWGTEPLLTSEYARVAYATAFGLISFVTIALLNQPVPPIVYKAF